MDDQEIAVQTWENIAKLTPYSEQTLRKRFGREMLSLGIVIKSHIGRSKRLIVWGWPSMIIGYFRQKAKMGEL